ncbi:MAG: VanW family protein, partial [Firmicutes bacterium]|nr:VanW family protein [Bacillota bacterium]
MLAVTVLGLGLTVLYISLEPPGRGKRVLAGVTAGGVDLAGLSQSEGLARLQELEESLRGATVTLVYGDHRRAFGLAQLDLRLDRAAVMEQALAGGRRGFFLSWFGQRRELARTGYRVPLAFRIDRERTAALLSGDPVFYRPALDASWYVASDDTVVVVPSQDGYRVDTERLERDLGEALNRGERPFVVTVALEPVPPRRTTAEVRSLGLSGLLASYTTRFDPAQTNRTYNIAVAAEALNGLLVPPGQAVSFNEIVGPRSQEAGYKEAPVILNNTLVTGPGGGVCQVSSTLYNCVLLAGLEVLERANHSLPVDYVPLGLDATVVYGYVDLKFRNNTGSYLYLTTRVAEDTLTVKIYGNAAQRKRIRLRSWVEEEFPPQEVRQPDPNLEKGREVVKQEGTRGYRVAAERIVTEGGAERREPLPPSYYPPADRVVAVGT